LNIAFAGDKEFIRKLTEITLANLENEAFSGKEISREVGVSVTFLNKRLHFVLQKTISQFIREVRLQRAMELLHEEILTAAEVSLKVGFGSPAYFSTCFSEYFGYPPGEVKKREFGKPEEDVGGKVSDAAEGTQETKPFEPTLVESSLPVKKGLPYRIYRYAAAVVIIIVVGFAFYYWLFKKNTGNNSSGRISKNDYSIAVLPFKNLNKEDVYQYFAEGITGSILNNLMYIDKLKVISLISAEIFGPGNQSTSDIVKKTEANYILSGSIQYDSGRFLILVQLTEAKNNLQIWSDKIEGEMSGIFKVQSDIAKKIAIELQTVLTQKEIKQINRIPTMNMEAYSYYLKGRYFLNRRENKETSLEYFKKAIATDPYYAEAYAGLGDAFFIGTKGMFFPRPEGYIEAKKQILRALELDNKLAEAHATLGAILAFGEWKWAEAENELQEAIRLNPNCITAHQYYGEMLLILRRFIEARTHLNLASELEPTSSLILILSARCYAAEGKFPEALEDCRKVIELTPQFWDAYFYNFYIYRRIGEELKAVDAIEQALSVLEVDKKYAVKVKEVYRKSGMTGLYNMLIVYESEDLEFGILGLARTYYWLGEKEKTLDCLEKAMAMEAKYPDLPRINCDIDFEELRNDPRFQALLKKMGLSAYQSNSSFYKPLI
jgi:TolB-like protein/AraC-like DNA-binding protein